MNFKSLRSDKLKLTQEEFANLYGISIQEVQEQRQRSLLD